MKKIFAEKNIVIILFIAVLVIFSMAEKDSKKLVRLYSSDVKAGTQPHFAKTQEITP